MPAVDAGAAWSPSRPSWATNMVVQIQSTWHGMEVVWIYELILHGMELTSVNLHGIGVEMITGATNFCMLWNWQKSNKTACEMVLWPYVSGQHVNLWNWMLTPLGRSHWYMGAGRLQAKLLTGISVLSELSNYKCIYRLQYFWTCTGEKWRRRRRLNECI